MINNKKWRENKMIMKVKILKNKICKAVSNKHVIYTSINNYSVYEMASNR